MKTGGENPKESLGKDPEKTKQNIAVGKNTEENSSVGQPAGQPPTVGFSTVGDSGRLVGRPLFPTRELNSLSVDRAGRPDPTKSKALEVGRPPGRPKCTNALWCMLVDCSVNQ